jgi:hypothetical protein
MIAKTTIDRAIAVAAAVSTPVVALLIDNNVISATSGVDIGAIVAAAVGAYHGGAQVQRKRGPARHAATPATAPSAPLAADGAQYGFGSPDQHA